MKSSAAEVSAFYEGCADHGGLTRMENPVVDHALKMTELSRVGPGFYAENDNYQIGIEIYQHKDSAFWRVKHGAKLPASFRSKKEPKYLILVDESEGRLTLRNPDTGDECWAPSSALSEGEPRHFRHPKQNPPKEETILWSLLPPWIQLKLEPGTQGTACATFLGGTAAGISAMKFDGDPREMFEACLDSLDAHGFDRTSIDRPNHSYYLRPMTGGRQVEARIQADTGDSGGFTVVSTLDTPSLYVYYSTQRTFSEVFPI